MWPYLKRIGVEQKLAPSGSAQFPVIRVLEGVGAVGYLIINGGEEALVVLLVLQFIWQCVEYAKGDLVTRG